MDTQPQGFPQDCEQVAAYLRDNPEFLAERPQLFATLAPPRRVHGEKLADHMTAMVGAARAQAREMAQQAEDVLAAGRAAAGLAERVQEAALAAVQASDALDCVTEAWPGLLGVDCVGLVCEGEVPRWRNVPPGTVARVMMGRPVQVRDAPGDAALLHAEAARLARRDVLVLLPCPRPSILALASRDPAALPAGQSWSFLGRLVTALLGCGG